jgi:hypothetical protein
MEAPMKISLAPTQGPEAWAVMLGDERIGTVAFAGPRAWRHTDPTKASIWSEDTFLTAEAAAQALLKAWNEARIANIGAALGDELDHRAARRADGHDTLGGEAKNPAV